MPRQPKILPFLSNKLINLVESVESEGVLKDELKKLVDKYIDEIEKKKTEKKEKTWIN
jgi:type II secretory pathway component PulF